MKPPMSTTGMSQILDFRDLRLWHFRDLPILSQWQNGLYVGDLSAADLYVGLYRPCPLARTNPLAILWRLLFDRIRNDNGRIVKRSSFSRYLYDSSDLTRIIITGTAFDGHGSIFCHWSIRRSSEAKELSKVLIPFIQIDLKVQDLEISMCLSH